MNFCKTGSSDAWSVRHHTHKSHLPSHPGKILPNRPKVDAYRHPGDQAAPLPRYQVYPRHPGGPRATKWLP